MGFKDNILRATGIPLLLTVIGAAFFLWQTSIKADSSLPENADMVKPAGPLRVMAREAEDLPKPDAAMVQQLERDRQEQKQTKYLKIKLEQTNLELEREKAMAQINQLRVKNGDAFRAATSDRQKDFPAVRVDYIGGDSVKKEAILSIGGVRYQVKERSLPTDHMQVLSISDTGVTVHFSGPQELTKTIDYKPE